MGTKKGNAEKKYAYMQYAIIGCTLIVILIVNIIDY